VAVEKLVAPKFAKIKSRQDALQTTFSVFLDIFYPPNLAVWDEKGVFQQPRLLATVTALPPSRDAKEMPPETERRFCAG
jgi:hypothetical protein